MKIHFLSFASSIFYKSLKRIEEEAKLSGFFDTVTCIKAADLSFRYRLKNIFILNRFTRGYGYWIWKSYVTKSLLAKIENGDILLYADAGSTINREGKKRFDEYIEMLIKSEFSNLSFQTYHSEKKYTKGDLFKHFGLENDEMIKNSEMLNATIFFIRKDNRSIALVDEWYSISHCKRGLINDTKSKYQNDPEFIDHRHDQSVFSMLRKLRGSLIIRDETFFYKWDENKEFPIHARRLK